MGAGRDLAMTGGWNGVNKTVVSRSILPQYTRFESQNNRAELLFRLIPLPPSHCHSLGRCLSFTHQGTIWQRPEKKKKKKTKIAAPRSILPRSTRFDHQNNRAELLFRLIQLPPSHCHSLGRCLSFTHQCTIWNAKKKNGFLKIKK
jgi:prepilin signal peptidase PulO-like enzyme (type II secretory pathway)